MLILVSLFAVASAFDAAGFVSNYCASNPNKTLCQIYNVCNFIQGCDAPPFAAAICKDNVQGCDRVKTFCANGGVCQAPDYWTAVPSDKNLSVAVFDTCDEMPGMPGCGVCPAPPTGGIIYFHGSHDMPRMHECTQYSAVLCASAFKTTRLCDPNASPIPPAKSVTLPAGDSTTAPGSTITAGFTTTAGSTTAAGSTTVLTSSQSQLSTSSNILNSENGLRVSVPFLVASLLASLISL